MPPPPLRKQKHGRDRTGGDPAVLAEGCIVAGKYRLVERIGTGSMGSVWRADHIMLGHSVAIKFMHASVDAYPEGRVRFEREAKLSARLGEASQHICRVTDFGVLEASPFVVMELLKGEELLSRLKRDRVLPLPLCVEIVNQLCKALSVAHDAGVVHRDLKPANVFLLDTGETDSVLVKLLDFGVAKADIEHEDTQGTRTGTIFGTPGYMSPEQITADAAIDPRADLWSVVVLAYRMLTGKTPFGAGSLRELGMRILSTDAPPPSRLRPDLPPAFDDWVRKGLSKRREDRFATASELAAALQAVARQPSAVASPLPVAEAPPISAPLEDPTTYDALSRSAAPPVRASRWRIWGPVLVIGAGAAVVTVGLGGRGVTSQAALVPAAPTLASPPQTETANERGTEPGKASQTPSASPSATADPAAAALRALEPNADLAEDDEAATPAASAATPVAAPRPGTRRVEKPAPTPAIEERAAQLWNKKDEL